LSIIVGRGARPLVVKHHRGGESGKFVNVAVLEGDQIKVVDERASRPAGLPALALSSLLGFGSPASWIKRFDSVNVLVQLAVRCVRMAAAACCWWCPPAMPAGGFHRPADSVRGGPAFASSRSSRVIRSRHRRPPVAGRGEIARWKRGRPDGGRRRHSTDQHLRADGVRREISRRKKSPLVEQVTVTEPVEATSPSRSSDTARQRGICRPPNSSTIQRLVWRPRGVAGMGFTTRIRVVAVRRHGHAHRVETLLL
jgi:hypothetical protein